MLKVLFVDNDATMRIIAKKTIEGHWDCKVFLAANGAEAIKIAHMEWPALILLDVIMPGLDGIQTLRKIREQGCQSPAIFVTAKADMSSLLGQEESLAVLSVIQKPFTPSILIEECGKVLNAK